MHFMRAAPCRVSTAQRSATVLQAQRTGPFLELVRTTRGSSSCPITCCERPEQLRGRHIERHGQAADHVQSWRSQAAFDPADVSPMETRALRDRFLRQTEFVPQLADTAPERKAEIFHA